MKLSRHIAILLCVNLVAPLAAAKDIAGGKDHPLISRFTGSQLDGYQVISYGQGDFYTADPTAPTKELLTDKTITIEGKLTRLLYLAPKGKTPLEVHRNYEQALKMAGADIVTSVNGKNAYWEPSKHWQVNFSGMTFQGIWATDVSPFWRDGLYVYGVLKRDNSVWHISILTAQNFNENEPQAAVAVQIIEPAAMATGQATVNAEAMHQGLNANGKIALYGIYFDTGKSDIKPESKAQLEQMATLLRQDPKRSFFIVGHTDNQGDFESNLTLSQRRAETVATTLVKQYKIQASQLTAKGAANISPVSSNSTEAGRTKNRRVELVAQ